MSQKNKKHNRIKRAIRTRIKLRELNQVRLCIHKTSRHMYAQIISGDGSRVLTSASTLEPALKEKTNYSGNVRSAELLGRTIAERAAERGIKKVAFDRSGFKYHGRVQALADNARNHGLDF